MCTNAGGLINTATATGVASPFVIPRDCLPSKKTTEQECAAIASLWNSKFNYCCPFGSIFASSGTGIYPQVKKNDPKALSSWPSVLATKLGVVQPVKWGGKGVGCHVFFDCSSYTTKEACKASGTVCVWEKNVCLESSSFISKLEYEIE